MTRNELKKVIAKQKVMEEMAKWLEGEICETEQMLESHKEDQKNDPESSWWNQCVEEDENKIEALKEIASRIFGEGRK